jgi:hypothetical protein
MEAVRMTAATVEFFMAKRDPRLPEIRPRRKHGVAAREGR